jgi:hypothetical protein
LCSLQSSWGVYFDTSMVQLVDTQPHRVWTRSREGKHETQSFESTIVLTLALQVIWSDNANATNHPLVIEWTGIAAVAKCLTWWLRISSERSNGVPTLTQGVASAMPVIVPVQVLQPPFAISISTA